MSCGSCGSSILSLRSFRNERRINDILWYALDLAINEQSDRGEHLVGKQKACSQDDGSVSNMRERKMERSSFEYLRLTMPEQIRELFGLTYGGRTSVFLLLITKETSVPRII